MSMVRTFSSLACAIILSALSANLSAAAPQQRNQAAGYYRLMVGDFEVTALSDGTARVALDHQLPSLPPERAMGEFQRWFQTVPYEMSLNAFLINTGSRLILIDTGLGELLKGRAGGRLMQNLIASGYRPEQVDAVLISHFHVDHVSGLSEGGNMAFPNAVIYLSEPEKAYWIDSDPMKSVRPELRDYVAPSRAALKPYLDAGKVQTFAGSASLWEGVHAEVTPGHSPGHAVYSISSRNQQMSFIGDLVHVREIQFDQPDTTFIYDSDYAHAVDQRKRIFDQLAKSRTLVATSHLSFPGIGHVRSEGAAFDWLPVPYSLKSLK
jgi:glyoxylase-like metal-dependent hydrolase (beta-lactamase superfamily II)